MQGIVAACAVLGPACRAPRSRHQRGHGLRNHKVSLGWIALVAGVLPLGPVLAQDKIVELRINQESRGRVALLFSAPLGTLIERAELRGRGIKDEFLDSLPSVPFTGCADCVVLESVGHFEEDRLSAVGQLTVAAADRPETVLFARPDRQRAPLQYGPAFTLNYAVLGRQPEEDRNSQAYVLEPALSLGPVGTLRGGWSISKIAGGPRTTRPLDLRFQRYFVGPALELEAGEIRTRRAFNDGGQALLGLVLSRDFSINPDLSRSPLLNFYTELETPSTVQLFVNGVQRRQQEIAQPGPVRLSDFPAEGSGRVNIVVTDAAGTEQVLSVDLYQDRDLLNPGQVDFSMGAGVLNSDIPGFRDAPLAEGFFRIGITHAMALGLSGTYARYRDEDRVESLPRLGAAYRLGRVGLTWRNRALGKLEVSYARHEDDRGSSDTVRTFVGRAQLLPGGSILNIGAVYFGDRGLRSVTQEDIGFEGFRVFAGINKGPATLVASGFRFGDVDGYSADLALQRGAGGIFGINVTDSSVAAPLFQLRLGWRFGRRAIVAATGRYDEATQVSEAGGVVRILDPQNRYGLAMGYSEPVGTPEEAPTEGRGRRYSAGADLRTEVGSARLDYRHADDITETSFNITGALLLDPQGQFALTRRLPDRSGLLRVSANRPGLRATVGGRDLQLGDSGEALVPISAFGAQRVRLAVEDLPLGEYLQSEARWVAVHPGQRATAEFRVQRFPVRVALPGVVAGTRVTWSGGGAVYDGQSVLVEDPPQGALILTASGARFEVVVPEWARDAAPLRARRLDVPRP